MSKFEFVPSIKAEPAPPIAIARASIAVPHSPGVPTVKILFPRANPGQRSKRAKAAHVKLAYLIRVKYDLAQSTRAINR